MMPRSGVDYASDNITVYRYCRYGCRYCWAWRLPLFAKRISSGKYDPVEEAKRYLNKSGRTIVVSFTADPYPPEEREKRLTRKVLEILAMNPCNKVLVLTKNPVIPYHNDKDIFIEHEHIWLGTTITTLDPVKARSLEPKAPSPTLRLSVLRWLHEEDGHTWLSIEPIIPYVTYPEDIVEATLDYVDWYVLGAFNYNNIIKIPKVNRYIPENGRFTKRELTVWYGIHAKKAIEILKQQGKPFFIKKELKKYLEVIKE